MRRTKMGVMTAILVVAASIGSAYGGGCLQGTFVYYDAEGAYSGHRTVGCGADDGTWGVVTSDSSFTQGCASPI